MTIPLDNLYDYIFSLTGHTNKNLIMYRFDPHGSKNIKNLTTQNHIQNIMLNLKSSSRSVRSWHHKILICNDQEPLYYTLYDGKTEEKKELYQNADYIRHENSLEQKIAEKKKNIDGSPEIVFSVYDKKILLHSEKESKDLEKYEKNGFVGAYYWSHAFISLDWYRFAEHDEYLNYSSFSNFSKHFNIYCRGWSGVREYRLKFLSTMIKNNIDKYANIFFSEYNDQSHFSNSLSKTKEWNISIKEKELIDKSEYITKNNSDPSLSASYSVDDYKNSAIDVVLETVFDQNKIFLTEKILRPIACGKPFILVSEKNALQYLKSYGFKSFDGLIDESYDTITDPSKRMEKIIETMKKISNLTQNEKNELFCKMHLIAEENKKWFFSNDFFNLIKTELKTNLQHSLSVLDNPKNQTAKELWLVYRSNRLYKKYLKKNAKHRSDQIVSEYPERIELSKKNIGIS